MADKTKDSSDNRLYWTFLTGGTRKLVVAATSEGLSYVGGWEEAFDTFESWARKSFVEVRLIEDEEAMRPYVRELEQYFAGERTDFSIPTSLQGTAFQREVWAAMCRVPYGRTASYADIAASLQKPQAVRAVGTAIGRNPVLIVAPCHRIIGKNGTLTGYRGGLEMKKQLLGLENPTHLA
ncbi:methylated-DNA--[protein]-cysteine S-methyltransferase [Cohnella endophytica]|uniref:Methylated-DNA--protein-cysteine methyltransferase n=1 Tax=Cohnella endophytica TaxID=2419778 RepID=A0A494Y7G0_9BACL|nr:methylated-DNA--[protein]-cysteine S-methyltransferase [Cohnella endophytica]RKP58013.1 methylated-DNA--[protein]-cysteine S-methyltransferase [Cohnella endophytica]